MPPLLVGWPFQVHEPGATVDPLALDRSTTRSEIAGVVTTEGPVAVGTGRSMTRVQALVASAAPSSAMVAFMWGSSLSRLTSLPVDPQLRGPVRARALQPLAELPAQRRHAMERKQKDKDQVEGEGSYTGSKDYNERTKKFVDSGKVDEAARNAEPQNEQERQAMQKAERVGKEKAKGEDPALNNPNKVPHDGHGHTQRK